MAAVIDMGNADVNVSRKPCNEVPLGNGHCDMCAAGHYERCRYAVPIDKVAEKLDEMADLCEHWKRHRENGRNPTAVRAALLMLSQECTALVTPNVIVTGLAPAQEKTK